MYNAVIVPFTSIWWICFLSTITIMVLSFTIFRKLPYPYKKRTCQILSFFLFFDTIFYQFLIYQADLWEVRTSLPLHFCNLMEIFAAIALVSSRRWFFEVSYLLGMVAPFQAIVTPAFALPPEGYYFFAFFLGHGLLIMAPLFLAFGLDFSLRKGAFWKIPLTFLPIVFSVYLFNCLVDGNYMYLCHNPPLLHPLNNYTWPWYIFIWIALFFASSFFLSLFLKKKEL